MSNVACYENCQFAYTASTEKAVMEGQFAGTEKRDTAEYNVGTKVTCTTRPSGLCSPRRSAAFAEQTGRERIRLRSRQTGMRPENQKRLFGQLATVAFNNETNVRSAIQTKE